MNSMNRKNTLLLAGLGLLVVALIAGRIWSDIPNFTPVAAIALFSGFLFRNRLLAITVPLAGMLVSDLLFEGVYQWEVMAVVYGAMMVPALLGGWMRKPVSGDSKWGKMLVKGAKLGALAGISTVVFFLTTNFAVWAFSGMYAPTTGGLAACYTAAIPFVKPMLLGDLFYSFGIFGLFGLVQMAIDASRQKAVA